MQHMDTGPEIQQWQNTVLDSHDALSEKSPLASLFSACSELFTLLIQSLSQETPQSLLCELQRSHDRLILWADAYDIEQGDFEGKLKLSQRIGDFTLRTLKNVCRALTRGLLPLVDQHGARAAEISLKAANLSIMAEKLSVLIQGDDYSEYSSSDESTDSGTEDDDDTMAYSEKLREVTKDLTTDTEFLLDLGARFDEQVVNPLVNEEAVDPQTVDGWDPSEHFAERIRRLYPSCDNDLAKRLGKANWERVLKFQESKERNAPESVTLATAMSIFVDPTHLLHEPKDTTSLFNDSGLGTSVQTSNHQARSRYAASLTTQGGWNNNVLSIPKLSTRAKLGNEFSCIACGERLKIQDEAKWNSHIITDLQPYMCLEAGCESLVFLSKSSWIRHLKHSHDSLDDWTAIMCRFCHKLVPSGMDSIVEHLADHLENISVMALPTDQSTETQPPSTSAPAHQPPSPSQQLPMSAASQVEVVSSTESKAENLSTIKPTPSAASSTKDSKPVARVLYDFAGREPNELSVKAGGIIEIVQKEVNGWWLARSVQGQAWVPSTYVDEVVPEAPALARQQDPQPLISVNRSLVKTKRKKNSRRISQNHKQQDVQHGTSDDAFDSRDSDTFEIEESMIDYSDEEQQDGVGSVRSDAQASPAPSQLLHHVPTQQTQPYEQPQLDIGRPTSVTAGSVPQLGYQQPLHVPGHLETLEMHEARRQQRLRLRQQQARAQAQAQARTQALRIGQEDSSQALQSDASSLTSATRDGMQQSVHDHVAPGMAHNPSQPSPTITKDISNYLPPELSPEGSAMNQESKQSHISAEKDPNSDNELALEEQQLPTFKPRSKTRSYISSQPWLAPSYVHSFESSHSVTYPTPGDAPTADDSSEFFELDPEFATHDPWFPLLESSSEMPPPPSPKSVSVLGYQPSSGRIMLPSKHDLLASDELASDEPDNRTKGKEVESFPETSTPSSSLTARTSAVSGVNSQRRDGPSPPFMVDNARDLITMKRARNTLAARKSRERRAQRLDELEQKIAMLEAERNHWKEAFMAMGQDKSNEDTTGASVNDKHE